MKEYTCIVCPNGCELKLDEKTGSVSGNRCPKGGEFALSELRAPKRTISSTVRTSFTDCPVVPVRVSKEIPKEMIFDLMKEINAIVLDKRLKKGDVVIVNVLDTGADVIITSDLMNNGERYGKHSTHSDL